MTMTAKPASGRHRMSWGGLLGVLLIVQLSACDSSCFLDTSGLVSDHFRYDCRATIQSANGVRSMVTSADLTALRGSPDDTIFVGDPTHEGDAAFVGGRFARYLRVVTEERAGDPEFTAVYGEGPFCVVGAVLATATDVLIESGDDRVFWGGTLAPLMACPCAEACGNEPGFTGVLQVEPTSAEMPHHVDFGPVPVGGLSTRDVTLTNTGDGRLCLDTPTILGSSPHGSDFSLALLGGCDTAPEGGVVLPPGGGGGCRFRVTFRPTDDGPRSAHMPGARGCGEIITLGGVGVGGVLTASPAPACFSPVDPGDTCTIVPIRIDNLGAATVSLSAMSLTGAGPDGWELLSLTTGGGDPVDLMAGPHPIGPGEVVVAEVQACPLATAESALRLTHNGSDYGAPGSPTGDVDSGSPLVVRLLPRSSGCTP